MKLWAVVIGRKVHNLRYIAYKSGSDKDLAVYETRTEARVERQEILKDCGHKAVHTAQFIEID